MIQAIYRRYRPQIFDEVIGQDQVTQPLKNALKTGRINHAYLFSGPRGCGKTTSARIMARCLNCEQGPTDMPCGTCPSCVELSINGNGSLDVVEIDAASHNGVEDARALREKAFFAPVRDRYKIFILDEAHMVTTQGFNALLKLVEEPPEHVKFIFATTEPEKVISTIRSRTHHYPFRLVAPQTLREFLAHICDLENISYDNAVISLIVRAGAGSVRDSLSILDQVISGSLNGTLEYEQTRHLLGYTDNAMLDAVIDAFAAKDGGVVYELVEKIVDSGQDPRRFTEDLLEKIRDLILVGVTSSNAKSVLLSYSEEQLNKMYQQAKLWGMANLNNAATICVQSLGQMVGATSARIHLELLCARILVPALNDKTKTVKLDMNKDEKLVSNTSSIPSTINASELNTKSIPHEEKLEKNGLKDSFSKHQIYASETKYKDSDQVVAEKETNRNLNTGLGLGDSGLSIKSHPEDEQFNTLAKTKKPGDLLAPASFGKPVIMPNRELQNKENVFETNNNNVQNLQKSTKQPINELKEQIINSDKNIQNSNQSDEMSVKNHVQTQTETNNIDFSHSDSNNCQSDLIRLRWDEILEKIKADKKSTWTLISRNAKPGAYDGKILHLHFDTQALASMFSTGTHIQVTIKAIYEILGLKIQIKPTETEIIENTNTESQKNISEHNLNNQVLEKKDNPQQNNINEAQFLAQDINTHPNLQTQNNIQDTKASENKINNKKQDTFLKQNESQIKNTNSEYTNQINISKNEQQHTVQKNNLQLDSKENNFETEDDDFYTDEQLVDSYVTTQTDTQPHSPDQPQTQPVQQKRSAIDNIQIILDAKIE